MLLQGRTGDTRSTCIWGRTGALDGGEHGGGEGLKKERREERSYLDGLRRDSMLLEDFVEP